MNEFIIKLSLFFLYLLPKIRKKMLLSQIYFLPSIVSLLWFFSFLLKNKSYRQGLFCCAEGLSIAFYAVLGTYFYPDVHYDTMVKVESVGIPCGLLFPVFLVSFMYMHYSGKRLGHRFFFLLVIPAIVVGVSINLLSFLLGFDVAADICRQHMSPEGLTGTFDNEMARIYCLFRYDIFRFFNYVNIITIAIFCFSIMHRQGYRFGDIYRFFFRRKPTTRSRTIAVMYLVELLILASVLILGRMYISSNVISGVLLTIALATVKHIIAYLEFYSDDDKMVTLYELSHLTLFYGKIDDRPLAEMTKEENAPAEKSSPEENNMSEEVNSTEDDNTPEEENTSENGNAPEEEEKEEALEVEETHIENLITMAHIKMDKRIEQFRELMEDKKVWTDEDLTAQTICDMMDIGKTTLSALISQHYDSTFRDLVNQYRIEEAKKFMVENPKSTQEIVAEHCGFKNAQYFNTQFKKLVGETPAMWLASNHTK